LVFEQLFFTQRGGKSLAKVAVVGGGSAGMGAAIALAKADMDVSLFEAEPRLGGHCFSVSVELWDRRTFRVDAGVSEFNQPLSGNLHELMRELKLPCYPVNHDASFMMPDRATVWFSRTGTPQFRRPLEDQQAFLDDLRRFDETCSEVLDDATYIDWSVQRYLDAKQYSQVFRRLYFEPQAHGWFPMLDRPADRYPIRNLVASWRALGLAGTSVAKRMVVQGGMHVYCNAVERWLRERRVSLYLSTRVASIARLGGGVKLRALDRAKSNLTFWFDHVIVATNCDQVIPLLEDAVEEEARISFACQRARLVVHQDPLLLPADRATWGAYNYVVAADSAATPATVTLYANRLQNLPASVPDVFVTLNPIREPDPEKVLINRTLALPVGGGDGAEKLDALQGKRRTWFCGSYLREPCLHEQAYRCGLDTAQRLIEAVADASMQFESGTLVSAGGFDDFLREIPLIADLDPRALSEVQLAARPFQVDAGTTLFRQGDPSDGLYLIKHGEIDILRRFPGDKVVHLARLGHGAVIGEVSLLDHSPRSTHAVAASPASGYFVSYERFRILQSDFRPAAFAVMNCFRREVATRARNRIGEIAALLGIHRPPSAPTDTPRWAAPTAPAGIDEVLLKSLPFFRTLGLTDLREFIAPLKRFDFAPGELVYAAGEEARSCLIIVRGAQSMSFPRGEAAIFAIRGPGQIIGELALMDGGTQPFDCRTREPTIAFELDLVQFELLRRGGSVMAQRFFETVTSSIVTTLRKADAHFARLMAERRLGHHP
jgi:predicted NAD/FAD-binding protein/CRP-like cAMP-binding protein